MPPKGINGRANMQKFQMNSKKYGGNPFKYTSLVSSVGRASKGGMWNSIQRRAAPAPAAPAAQFAEVVVSTGNTTDPDPLQFGLGFIVEVYFTNPGVKAFAVDTNLAVLAQFRLYTKESGGNEVDHNYLQSVEMISTGGGAPPANRATGTLKLTYNSWEGGFPPSNLYIEYTNSGQNTLKTNNTNESPITDFTDILVYGTPP